MSEDVIVSTRAKRANLGAVDSYAINVYRSGNQVNEVKVMSNEKMGAATISAVGAEVTLGVGSTKFERVAAIISKHTAETIRANNALIVEGNSIASMSANHRTTIQEINNLFVSAKVAMESSRDSLYDFLCRIYDVQVGLGDSAEFRQELLRTRNALLAKLGRKPWNEKKMRKDESGEILKEELVLIPTDHLLFIATNGLDAYGPLRSKYKKVIGVAMEQGIAPSSFRIWLKSNGGVVKILSGFIERIPSKNADVLVDVESLIRDYTVAATSKPRIDVALPAANESNFAVIIAYRDSISKIVHHVGTVTDKAAVQSALRSLSKQDGLATSRASEVAIAA